MIILLIILLLVLLVLAAGYFAFYYSVVRTPPSHRRKPANESFLPFRETLRSGAEWLSAQAYEPVTIRSRDGLKLSGRFFPAENPNGTMILVHGYRSNPANDFGTMCPFYLSKGWNLLAVNQRACGNSEGVYITFGVKERFDLHDWIVYLCDRFGPDHPVVVNGISMGCTTALMSLGTGLPENVRGVIADCGFTTPLEELKHLSRQRFGIAGKPLTAVVGLYAKLFAGFGFSDYSTLTALKQSKLPILFLHGEADSFVPVRFTVENFAACEGEKKLLTIPEAGHAVSCLVAPEQCQRAIGKFLDRMAAV